MIAKCGTLKAWHWAHQAKRVCDPWWENETEWHRAWKNEFPSNWQEVVHRAEDGERHIADVKTDDGWVIEFQHSYLKPEERQARNAFYQKLVWVVDGTRRKKDGEHFLKAIRAGKPLDADLLITRIPFPEQSALLREWGDTKAPVLFDLGGSPWLWWLFPKSPNGRVYVAPFSRARFLDAHRPGGTDVTTRFLALVENFEKCITNIESPVRTQTRSQAIPQALPRSMNPLLRRRSRKRL